MTWTSMFLLCNKYLCNRFKITTN